MTSRTLAALAATTIALVACGETSVTGTTGPAPANAGPAETACMRAVSTNAGGARSSVVSSEASGAGTRVALRAGDGTTWRCVTSGTGVVAELSVV